MTHATARRPAFTGRARLHGHSAGVPRLGTPYKTTVNAIMQKDAGRFHRGAPHGENVIEMSRRKRPEHQHPYPVSPNFRLPFYMSNAKVAAVNRPPRPRRTGTMRGLSDRRVLLTGGASGIGRAT